MISPKTDTRTMCLTRLCAETSRRMAELIRQKHGPMVENGRRVQGIPDVFRVRGGKLISISFCPDKQARVSVEDARCYLQLLRDGYMSTIPHWQEFLFQNMRGSDSCELWIVRQSLKPEFVFVADSRTIRELTKNVMAGEGSVGWWIETPIKAA